MLINRKNLVKRERWRQQVKKGISSEMFLRRGTEISICLKLERPLVFCRRKGGEEITACSPLLVFKVALG